MNRHRRRAAEARQRQQFDRQAKAFARTAEGAAMCAMHESLTTPDKEDWWMLVDGDDLYLTAAREHQGMAHAMHMVSTVSGMKAGGSKGSIETIEKSATGLGCVTVILPTDAAERGGIALVAWLLAIARKNDAFNVMTIIGSVPTAEAVKAWKDTALHQAQSAGEA